MTPSAKALGNVTGYAGASSDAAISSHAIATCPSKLARGSPSTSAPIASNQRPIPRARTVWTDVAIMRSSVTSDALGISRKSGRRAAISRASSPNASLKRAVRGPPHLANRALAPGERQGAKRRRPRPCGAVHAKNLGPPRRTVGTPAGAVEDDADHRLVEAELRDRGEHVRDVVLHADVQPGRTRERVLRRCVGGMEIVHDDLRANAEQTLEALDVGPKGLLGLEALEVAEVGRQIGAIADDETRGVLEVTSDREDGLACRRGETDGVRGVPARASHDAHAPGRARDDGVFHPAHDGPVVQEEGVHDADRAYAPRRRA